MYISTQNELIDFIARARSSEILAIDTEFLREKTYYPMLCLLQMATEDEDVIVDPFTIDSLEPIEELFADQNITKLFHAGSQDIEILYHEIGLIPRPIFDTQVAAALLGHSLQICYGSLVQSVCGVSLKKGDSYTDWSHRPLSKSQLAYAADDVIYLPRLYRKMSARLIELGRLDWLDSDFAELSDESRYINLPRERYKKLKRVNQLSRRQLSAARELSAWREETAIKRNIPRKWVLADEQIVEACKQEPDSLDALFLIRGMSTKLNTNDARQALAAIQRGLKADPSTWPKLDNANTNEASVDIEVSALETIVKLRAKENSIAPQVLASSGDLRDLARGYSNAEVLKGWRYEIVGKDLLAFMEGKLELKIENGVLMVTNRQ